MPSVISREETKMMTPTEIDADVKKLISIVCPNSVPMFLTVEPEAYAQVTECFLAIVEKIKRDGGSQVLGWQIWKSTMLVEAEFHAVWRSEEGLLKDITPKQIPISRILFLPDSRATYNGSQVDNIRINISGNPIVNDFIEIAKAVFRIENKGERAYQRQVQLEGKESAAYDFLKNTGAGVYFLAQNGKTRNGRCFCGSHDKYKHCHGKKLLEVLRSL
jgi:hypothetical protein